MTEDEAKTKWCPFVRFVFGATEYGAGNRFEGDSSTAADARAQSLCIGHTCMAWRRYHSSEMHGQGYCGLAGPQ